MWARLAEIALIIWLAVSPWILGATTSQAVNDVACAAVVLLLDIVSIASRRLRYAHLAIIPVGIWLVLFGLLISSSLGTAAAQNEMLVGIGLAMFAVIPTHATRLPPGWARFYDNRSATP